MSNIFTTMDSPIGRLVLIGQKSGDGVVLDSVSVDVDVQNGQIEDSAAFADVVRRLRGYFAGAMHTLDVPHTSRGTEFQRKVWDAVAAIPYGTTITYGELTERVGAGRDRVRAVAAAVGANPLLLVRPCHRVIGADGSLTGYAAGVQRKRFLLVHEGALQPQLV